MKQEPFELFAFCREVCCAHYYPENRFEKENCDIPVVDLCPFTAKEVFRWLKQNKFKIEEEN